MTHDWDSATGYCTHCGIHEASEDAQAWTGRECLATPNVHGMMHLLAKRAMERGAAKADGKILVEAFPKEPT